MRIHCKAAKLGIIIGTAILTAVLLATVLPVQVISDSPVELVEKRTQNSKTYQLADGKYRLVAFTGSIHYKDNPDDPAEQWKEINPNIQPSDRENWDWEVTKGHWHLLIKDDTTIALGKDGNWIGFRYEGFAYLDIDTKEYVVLQSRQAVTPVVEGNTIRWDNIFYGVNLEYIYTGDRFKENLEVTQVARDWCAANPPSNYGLNNQSTYLVGYLECDWKNAYPAEDADGNLINWDYDTELEKSVFFRHPVKDYIVSALPLDYARHDNVTPEDWVPIRKRFINKDDKHWLLFGSKITALNQLPSGTITLDPTSTFYSTASDGAVRNRNDNYTTCRDAATGDNTLNTLDDIYIAQNYSASSPNYRMFRGFLYFDTSALPDTCVITATTLGVRGGTTISENDAGQTDLQPYEGTQADPLADAEWDSFQTTILTDDASPWEYPISQAAYNTVTFNAAGRGIVNKTGPTKVCIRPKGDADATPPTQGGNEQDICSNEKGNGYQPKLEVTYTVVVAPTVTTSAATNVEETTATLGGDITDTGGENCDYRGFEWDIDSGALYADNWTEAGSFGTGSFTHGVTGLTKGELYYYRAMAHNTAGWGYGAEVTFLTKPDEPTSLQDTAHTDNTIDLLWTKGTGAQKTMVRYRTDQYPTDISDGTQAYFDTGTSTTVSSLSNGQIYYFRAWSYATEGGKEQYSDSTSDDMAYTSPGDPSNLDASNPTTSTIDLGWTKGTGGDKTMVRRKEGSYPTGPSDGAQTYFDTDNTTQDSGLDPGTTYYYRAWAYDSDSGYYSDGYSSDNETTTSITAPTVTNDDGATSITDTTARLRGELTDTGDENPTVHIYWGETDEGTASENWTHDENLGAKGLGIFYKDIGSLSENTTYFYRCYAINSGGNDWADSSANFTTEETPTILLPPSSFTATYVNDYQVDLSWVKGIGAVKTMIRGKYGSYPTDRTDGRQVYYDTGTSASDIDVDLDMRESYVYYRAWSENGSWSTDYAETRAGGVAMTLLAEAVFIIGLGALAMWRKHIILYMGAFVCLLLFAFHFLETSWMWGLPVFFLAGFMLHQSIVYWFK